MSDPSRKKSLILHGVLLLALVAACLVSLLAGAVPLPADDVWHSGILRLRLARTALGAVAGAGLSVAGVVFQAILRNPLAEPYVLGVSSGAGLGAALAIVLGLSAAGLGRCPPWPSPARWARSCWSTPWRERPGNRARPDAASCRASSSVRCWEAFSMFVVSVAPSEKLHSVVWWLLGNLQVFDWGLLRIVSAVVAAGLAISALFARDLNLMALGEEPAAHLGLDVERTKKLFFLLASLMTGATVAACGLIGFVGLIVPHTVRLVVGPDHRRLVTASALAGAAFLVLADSFARTIIAPREMPIGVITAMLGGPFFLVVAAEAKGVLTGTGMWLYWTDMLAFKTSAPATAANSCCRTSR